MAQSNWVPVIALLCVANFGLLGCGGAGATPPIDPVLDVTGNWAGTYTMRAIPGVSGPGSPGPIAFHLTFKPDHSLTGTYDLPQTSGIVLPAATWTGETVRGCSLGYNDGTTFLNGQIDQSGNLTGTWGYTPAGNGSFEFPSTADLALTGQLD